jgi:hypothetical protein
MKDLRPGLETPQQGFHTLSSKSKKKRWVAQNLGLSKTPRVSISRLRGYLGQFGRGEVIETLILKGIRNIYTFHLLRGS